MAINFPDNIKVNVGNPIDSRYLSDLNQPYTSVGAVTTAIAESQRYVGLTVLVKTGTTAVEYWFRDNVSTLIEKTANTVIPLGDFVTGATNIGYFSGFTGIQTLPIDNLVDNNYDGNYDSLYNYYYRDANQKIRIGVPTDNIPKRGYVKCSITPSLIKSWVWNEINDHCKGWIFVDGNIENCIGGIPSVATYYNGTSTFPYTATTWTTGSAYNNGSNAVINTVLGSLGTGSTLSIGGPVYGCMAHNNLHFRTLISCSPDNLSVCYNEAFVSLSAKTAITDGANIGTGVAVLKIPTTGTTLEFRRIRGSGSTTVTQVGDSIVINSVGGSGGTGGGTYNLSSPSVITVGGIPSGTTLTGKTSFQLFEELLVPTLYPTLTNPSNTIVMSPSGLFEIGCTISSIAITSNLNLGSISPQYTAASPYRSNGAESHCFDAPGSIPPTGCYVTGATSLTKYTTSYTVVAGTQTWGTHVHYLGGVQPKNSKGGNYGTPLASGETSTCYAYICGVYPLFATTATITTLTKQTLQNMSTANNIQVDLVADSSPDKQKFEIPCAWLGAPTNRPLVGVCQWNTVSSQWEYPGGSAGTSLAIWTCSAASETVQGNTIGYCRYTYNSTDRSAVCIRLVF